MSTRTRSVSYTDSVGLFRGRQTTYKQSWLTHFCDDPLAWGLVGLGAIPDKPPRCNAQTRDDPKATTRVQRQSQAAGIALFQVRTWFPPARYQILGRDPELGVQPSFIVRNKRVTASYRVTGDFYSCRFTIGCNFTVVGLQLADI